jgi:hypothetical protein
VDRDPGRPGWKLLPIGHADVTLIGSTVQGNAEYRMVWRL